MYIHTLQLGYNTVVIELVTGCASSRYERFETSPETIEQELRPTVTVANRDRLKENYGIDY